MTFSGIT